MIYLASSSPRRKELLQQMGVSFKVVPQAVEETHKHTETAADYVSRLALEKAREGMSQQKNQDIPVLGADTAVIFNGRILGKPKDKENAIEMLLTLSGQTHQVMTAVALVNQQQIEQAISISDVSFARLDRTLCEKYWHSGEPIDKAGSYGIQGLAALFIDRLKGSYSGVMGLPIYETNVLLNKFAIKLL